MSGSAAKASAKPLPEGRLRLWLRRWGWIAGLAALIVYIVSPAVQTMVLKLLFPAETRFVHSRLSLLQMTGVHLLITVAASLMSTTVGITLGLLVTRGRGLYFAEILQKINAFIQTFPPSAVIILTFPFLGFGWPPTLFALFLYSLFPVVGNTIVGIRSVAPAVVDAARGLGMTAQQRLFIVELPQAMPLILTGIRHAVILNIGTASIAAVIGGGGLGTIIISGLTLQNSALVLSGTIVIMGMALLGEKLFSFIPVVTPGISGQNPSD